MKNQTHKNLQFGSRSESMQRSIQAQRLGKGCLSATRKHVSVCVHNMKRVCQQAHVLQERKSTQHAQASRARKGSVLT